MQLNAETDMLPRMLDNSTTTSAPHPVLAEYYHNNDEKHSFLRRIFDDTASDYDRVEAALSLGSGPWYRRKALTRAGLSPGMAVLDVAVGTGLVAREALKLTGSTGTVIGVDPSRGMLLQARKSLSLPLVMGIAEQLPLSEDAFDFLSMGYALRHIADLRPTFAEYFRVLKPAGRVCILEITRPDGKTSRAALKFYFEAVLPLLARIVGASGTTRDLWKYYWETIDACVPGQVVMDALTSAGFTNVKRHRELGLFSEFTATKPTT